MQKSKKNKLPKGKQPTKVWSKTKKQARKNSFPAKKGKDLYWNKKI